jgi:hypothetical protein
VIGHDLRRGIPFPDRTFDLVYQSRMLGHFRPAEALHLMRECHRVLKPGGVLRVVAEDLEQMCRLYLQKLEAACAGDPLAKEDYEWMVIEIYDQATRESPGGRMAEYLSRDPLPNEAFIYSRTGEFGRGMVTRLQARARKSPARSRPDLRTLLSTLRATVRKLILTAVLGESGMRALEVGRFRLTPGQATYRFYDRYSLGQLFLGAGLSGVSIRTAAESAYRSWHEINLDLTADGHVAKPGTLIMEGIRPAWLKIA